MKPPARRRSLRRHDLSLSETERRAAVCTRGAAESADVAALIAEQTRHRVNVFGLEGRWRRWRLGFFFVRRWRFLGDSRGLINNDFGGWLGRFIPGRPDDGSGVTGASADL